MSEIGLVVKGKRTMGAFVVVEVGRVSSTMTPLQTHEIERLVHTLRHTAYGKAVQPGSKGFPYTLPITFGS